MTSSKSEASDTVSLVNHVGDIVAEANSKGRRRRDTDSSTKSDKSDISVLSVESTASSASNTKKSAGNKATADNAAGKNTNTPAKSRTAKSK